MMNTSRQSYKELSIPFFKEVFSLVDEVMNSHSVPYYLIGVNAMALELLKQGIKPSRGTKDIDFAIMISSLRQYEEISSSIQTQGFKKVKAPWTFYSEKYNVVIDLLPFGEVEEQDTVQFQNRYSDLHVLGFKEVLGEPTEVPIEELIVNIPPLPGMVILKLVAWSDRPEERDNDLADILKVIDHFFEFCFDEIVEYHHDTFPDEEFDQRIIAAEVLGRKARGYLEKSEALEDRITMVLNDQLTTPELSNIARQWARLLGRDIEYAFSLLEAFRRGITKR